MADLQGIAENLSTLTVMEAAQLVKMLEEKWGVSAAAPVAMMGGGAAPAAAAAVEEKTEFEVVLKEVGEKKINVIKVVREVTSLGLKEAKDLVDKGGEAVKKGLPKEEADKLAKELKDAGAEVEVKGA